MKRLFAVFILLGTVLLIGGTGTSYALGDTHSALPPVSLEASSTTAAKVCPPGTKASQNLAECAQCANAAGCVGQQSDPATTCSRASCDLIKTYIDPGITLLSALVGVACVISIISAGIQYTSSGGDPQKAAKAKSRIANTVVALLAYTFLMAFLEFLIPGGVIHPGG